MSVLCFPPRCYTCLGLLERVLSFWCIARLLPVGRNISSCLNAHFAGVVNYASLIFGYSSSVRVVKRFRKLATPVEEAGAEQPETTAAGFGYRIAGRVARFCLFLSGGHAKGRYRFSLWFSPPVSGAHHSSSVSCRG